MSDCCNCHYLSASKELPNSFCCEYYGFDIDIDVEPMTYNCKHFKEMETLQ